MTTPDEPVTPTPATPPTKAVAKRTRREKWRRRFFVLVTAIVLLAGAFRLLLNVLFPTVLDRVSRLYGLRADYDKLDLSVLGADVGIWGLRFTPLDGGQPIISTAYCRGAISTFALLKLQLHVQRVEAEDAEVLVERLHNGTLPLVERLIGGASETTKPTSSSPASLDAPLTIDTVRLQNARARFRDAAVTPATDVTMQMDLLVRDVGALDRKTRVELQLNSPETLAALYVTADGASHNDQIDANVDVRMVGLNLLPARAYLAPFGIVPQAQDISARAKGDAARGAEQGDDAARDAGDAAGRGRHAQRVARARRHRRDGELRGGGRREVAAHRRAGAVARRDPRRSRDRPRRPRARCAHRGQPRRVRRRGGRARRYADHAPDDACRGRHDAADVRVSGGRGRSI